MDFQTMFAAFIGATFAFLFFVSGEIVARSYERARLHYTAVHDLEFLLVGVLKSLRRRNWLNALDGFNAVNEEGSVNEMLFLPEPLMTLRDGIERDLRGIELVSKVMDLRDVIDNFNRTARKLNDTFVFAREHKFAGRLKRENYVELVDEYLVPAYLRLGEEYERIEEIVKALRAYNGVLLAREKPFPFNVQGSIISHLVPSTSVSDDELRSELERTQDELGGDPGESSEPLPLQEDQERQI